MKLGRLVWVAILVAFIGAIILIASCSSDAGAQEPTPQELQLRAERDRARLYARRLERKLRYHFRRAERLERALTRSRKAIWRARVTSPIGSHWLEVAFLCIHGHEGHWSAATGNGYYGGLQMDRAFMRTYGADFLRAFGPASNWPRSVQLAVAIRAYVNGRGFGPWPNTRRECGL